MKRLFLNFILLASGYSVYGGQDINSQDGYAILVGIAGTVTTGASLLCWYFHQNILKQDFAKKKSELSEIIHQLRMAVHFSVDQNVPILRMGTGTFDNSQSLITAFSQGEQARINRDDFIAGDLSSPPPAYASRPASFYDGNRMDIHIQIQPSSSGDELV
jgi:hypothetical protein